MNLYDFTVKTRKGADVALSDFKGKVVLVVNTAIDEYTFFTEGIKAKVVTFGTENPADYMAANVSYNEYAQASFDVIHDGRNLGRFVRREFANAGAV